jgi:hypothetical protein
MTMPSDFVPGGAMLNQGYMDGRGEGSDSLAAQSERWTQLSALSAQTPHRVLNQLSLSPVASNLSAPSQQGRLLPNGLQLPNTSNAASSETGEVDNYLRTSPGSM